MTTIDVNTGAYVGHRNLEETIFRTNLEAAVSIARQLRLRNLGGIIIIDFIDMRDEPHRRAVLAALERALAGDRAQTHIVSLSPLGLVEMTRKRTRESLEHLLCEPCPSCEGRGFVRTPGNGVQRDFSGNCATEPTVCQSRAADTRSSGRRGSPPRRGVRHAGRTRDAGRPSDPPAGRGPLRRRSVRRRTRLRISVAEMPAEPATGPPAGAGRVRLLAALIGGVLAARRPAHRRPRAHRGARAAASRGTRRADPARDRTRSHLQPPERALGLVRPRGGVSRRRRSASPRRRHVLRAPELVVGLDAWRSVRSGQLEAGRITLIDPDIDLGARAGALRRLPIAPGLQRAGCDLADARRVLARWRGGRIDIEGGTLRWPAAAPVRAPLLAHPAGALSCAASAPTGARTRICCCRTLSEAVRTWGCE